MILYNGAKKVLWFQVQGEINKKLWRKLQIPTGWKRYSTVHHRNKWSDDPKPRLIASPITTVKLTCSDERFFNVPQETWETIDAQLSLICG